MVIPRQRGWAAFHAERVGGHGQRSVGVAVDQERNALVRRPPRPNTRTPSTASRGRLSSATWASNSGSTRSATSAAYDPAAAGHIHKITIKTCPATPQP